MSKLDRKKFLRTSGLSLAALAFAGGAGTLITGCAKDDIPAADKEKELETVEHPIIVPDTIDPDEAAQIAWDSYKEGNG